MTQSTQPADLSKSDAVIDKYEALRKALAAGPTPGPWRADLAQMGGQAFGFSVWAVNGTRWHPLAYQGTYHHTNSDCYEPAEKAANAALIAACDPATLNSLLADADRARELEARVRALLWEDHPECCGSPVVGAEYMGQQEMVCCGCPEPSLLNDAQIVASLRAMLPDAAIDRAHGEQV